MALPRPLHGPPSWVLSMVIAATLCTVASPLSEANAGEIVSAAVPSPFLHRVCARRQQIHVCPTNTKHLWPLCTHCISSHRELHLLCGILTAIVLCCRCLRATASTGRRVSRLMGRTPACQCQCRHGGGRIRLRQSRAGRQPAQRISLCTGGVPAGACAMYPCPPAGRPPHTTPCRPPACPQHTSAENRTTCAEIHHAQGPAVLAAVVSGWMRQKYMAAQ